MAERLVVADASPLIGLAAAGAFDLLRQLFGKVTVTTKVRDEVLAGGVLPGGRELAEAIRAGWIAVADADARDPTFAGLDPGEASTISLATGHNGPCLVLMDEPYGRRRASESGIATTGVAGVLVAAKNAGLVGGIRPVLDRLTRSGFRLSDEVIRAVLEQAGEA